MKKINLFIISDYRNKKADLRAEELTDSYIRDSFDDEALSIYRSDSGKPYIEGREVFSVSHSEDVIAIAIASKGIDNIGLDIQKKREIDFMKLAKRFFSEREIDYISAKATAQEKKAAFYMIWTRKEAFAKYTGAGMRQILDNTEVLERSDVSFKQLECLEGYDCAICLDAGETDSEIEIVLK